MNFTSKILCILVVFISVFNHSLSGQRSAFSVNGFLKGLDSGSVTTILIGSSEKFRDIEIESTSSPVHEGKFSIKGSLSYPHAVVFLLHTKNKFIPTDIIYITKGVQSFECNIDSIKYKAPVIKNSLINNEYFSGLLSSGYDSVLSLYLIYETTAKRHSVEKNSRLKDSLRKQLTNDLALYNEFKIRFTYKYVKNNPGSYIGLWQTVDNFSTRGYLPLIDSSFKYLSDDLKTTKTGKHLAEAIKTAKALTVGELFPNTVFHTATNKKIKVLSYHQKKFLFVDFWFSNCGPCVKEFPELVRIYKTYKPIGLEIIAVTTDKMERKMDWLEAISKYNLTWKHLWDIDGSYANRNYINSFPTNFLIDKKGRIVAKNLKPGELESFLKQHFRLN